MNRLIKQRSIGWHTPNHNADEKASDLGYLTADGDKPDREEEEEVTHLLIWATPFLIVAAPVLAQPVSPEPGADPAAAPAKPKKVCRTFKVTGQRIAKTTCYTAEQWADLDQANEAAAKKFVTDVSRNGSKASLQGANTGPLFGLGPPQ